MVIFDYLEDAWNFVQEKTFDRLAEKLGVKYIEVEGIDYENTKHGKIYPLSSVLGYGGKVDDFDKEAIVKYPVRFFVLRYIPDKISDIVYIPGKFYRFIRKYFRHYFIKNYTIVKTDLKPGYWDVDTRLLHAIQSLCFEFVEEECHKMYDIYNDSDIIKGKGNNGLLYLQNMIDDPECTLKNTKNYKNIIKAYKWFAVERIKLLAEIEEYDYRDDIKKYADMENRLYREDTKHASLFVNARENLWT